jgi:hypothetical protein
MSRWRDLLNKIAKRAPAEASYIPPAQAVMSQREISQAKRSERAYRQRKRNRKSVQASRRKNRGTKRKT